MDSEEEFKFPDEISDEDLELVFIGLLLNNPRAISRFYFLNEDCFFSNKTFDNIYRSILFREGDEFSSEIARKNFKYPNTQEGDYELKERLKETTKDEKATIEEVYNKLKKLFMLKKYYIVSPTSSIQKEIIKIRKYKKYDEMTVDEVIDTIDQITVTAGLSKGILNKDATDFFLSNESNLTTGLELPFPIINKTFKGFRKGETSAFAMPSNYGKSRFSINLLSYIAFVKKQKVLMISNEMTEDKMKLCLITTILNNPIIQRMHKQKLSIDEGRILELKFKPDDKDYKDVDENGYILKYNDEKNKDFIKRLYSLSTEFKKVIAATKWLEKQLDNCIYFIHISEYTNEDLKKIILNYYYKEGIEYILYDTLKNDIGNIGSGEELKKTSTVLSTLAQKYSINITATMQLLESSTLPINLNINDLAESKTVKEVLDTLTLVKQISRENLKDYEYTENEEKQDYKNIEILEDANVRYYIFVVDKNRAGSKPKLLFRLNLAYNSWEELGFVRLKNKF